VIAAASVLWQVVAVVAFVLLVRARRGRRMILAALLAVPKALRWVWRETRSRRRRDSRRGFTPDERAYIIARAGGQCEWVGAGWARCQAFHGAAGVTLEADHVWPHALGGPTTVENGQALCGPHNRRKGSRAPTPAYLWRLRTSRARYMEKVPTPRRRGVLDRR
jgi:5-methylcytosine-specific restriction endonuclease McrA